MDAILYTSQTGFTAEYAKLLGEKTGLPVATLKDAGTVVRPGAQIIYLGWIMAGSVKDYKKAAKTYQVRAVLGVGMSKSGSETEDIRKGIGLPDSFPLFMLQGGLDLAGLKGPSKWIMTSITKGEAKRLSEKADRTPDEDDMLDLNLHGGSRVSLENLAPVLDWYSQTSNEA